ncbi:HCNGP domain-containing protein [Aspergillus saccharolyticus JOP 1030-1]|uniref:HCNGP-domain-containing protein n=1 Tax=Aspergillus saccharolyticus JOP 1030-1 TaxID=1450539 RepID=A0A318Z0T9_9EURO|nr:hypothetical protein BP01DRAFT_419385 [Aspergillus saccharolyticus JOP 1030-1]PYH40529.1 hypothetical protein BP01DRAFT_419385 [Aspergillus saccharolyticus JOP 1030-1]
MLGLAAYESSSEDDAGPNPVSLQTKQGKKEHATRALQVPANPAASRKDIGSEHDSMQLSDRPLFGPLHENPHHEQEDSPNDDEALSASRTIIHDLTLPPVPNLDIPPSPPGSPDPSADAKFAHFLSLKKQGVHFNEKLSGSVSLKNPGLLKAMMTHAGIDDGTQYYTSLPPAIWDAPTLPSWGFTEKLRQTQCEFQRTVEGRMLAGQRERIPFVAASSSAS